MNEPEAYPEFYRQLDFFDPVVHAPKITVVGAGGIGSWTVVLLAKMGLKRITVYDDDDVAPHNLATTCYEPRHLGMPKVEALRDVVKRMTGLAISIRSHRFRRLNKAADILVSAVDSAETRRMLLAVAHENHVPYYVDGRIGGENIRVYALRPASAQERDDYMDSLPAPGFASDLSCTGQQVIDVGLITASVMVRAIRQYLSEHLYNFEIIGKIGEFEWIVSDFIHCGKEDR